MFGTSGNSFQKQYPVTFNLIALNAVVWLAQTIITNIDLTEMGAMHYFTSPDFRPYQIVTSMFMHDKGSLGHLFMNMIGLYFFGMMLERVWGSKRFLLFYLICGIGANIITQFTIPYSGKSMAEYVMKAEGIVDPEVMKGAIKAYTDAYSSLGASGALMGVLAAAAYLFPNTPVMLMFIPIPIKLKWLVAGYIAYDLYGGSRYMPGDNIGHFAHLGGALIGFILVLIWNKTNRRTFY